MPLPAALLKKLAKRGLVDKKGESLHSYTEGEWTKFGVFVVQMWAPRSESKHRHRPKLKKSSLKTMMMLKNNTKISNINPPRKYRRIIGANDWSDVSWMAVAADASVVPTNTTFTINARCFALINTVMASRSHRVNTLVVKSDCWSDIPCRGTGKRFSTTDGECQTYFSFWSGFELSLSVCCFLVASISIGTQSMIQWAGCHQIIRTRLFRRAQQHWEEKWKHCRQIPMKRSIMFKRKWCSICAMWVSHPFFSSFKA